MTSPAEPGRRFLRGCCPESILFIHSQSTYRFDVLLCRYYAARAPSCDPYRFDGRGNGSVLGDTVRTGTCCSGSDGSASPDRTGRWRLSSLTTATSSLSIDTGERFIYAPPEGEQVEGKKHLRLIEDVEAKEERERVREPVARASRQAAVFLFWPGAALP